MRPIEVDGEKYTLVEEVQVVEHKEFSRGLVDHFDPLIRVDGDPIPNDYAVPQWLANEVFYECGVDLEEQGVTVVDPESEEVHEY